MDEAPDFLVVGHVTKDLNGNGSFTIGGTVTYAASTAANLGLHAAIVTRADPQLDLSLLEGRGVRILRLPSSETSTFQNIYLDGTRLQYLRAVAGAIAAVDIPAAWSHARIVHLGPLTQEISPDIVRAFPGALIGVTPQGWMRRWDGDGLVYPTPWVSVEEVMATADVLVYSLQDVGGDERIVRRYGSLARVMVVTQSDHGATVYVRGERPHHFPAFAAHEVDPTGAGDVFCAAYLIHLAETGDPYASARFANCVASFSVEAKGTQGIPSREQALQRLATRAG